MINGVTNSSQAAPTYQVQHQQPNPQVHKNAQNDQEPQDTVVLSKKATEAAQTRDADHDGDSR